MERENGTTIKVKLILLSVLVCTCLCSSVHLSEHRVMRVLLYMKMPDEC